mgnify:CR=1 FL=1
MATLTTKYSVGDRVYLATTVSTRKQHPCPDCLGSREWKAVAPSGREYSFVCPRCTTSFRHHTEASLEYTEMDPVVRALTIGSVRIDTNSDDGAVEYMCVETGVGSGTIHRERNLFEDEASALEAAMLKAATDNASIEWIVKQRESALALSDYQLTDAIKQAAEKKRFAWEAHVEMLFADLRDAQDMDEVRRVLGTFEARDAA